MSHLEAVLSDGRLHLAVYGGGMDLFREVQDFSRKHQHDATKMEGRLPDNCKGCKRGFVIVVMGFSVDLLNDLCNTSFANTTRTVYLLADRQLFSHFASRLSPHIRQFKVNSTISMEYALLNIFRLSMRSRRQKKSTKFESSSEYADRIDLAAEAIADLRLNSTGAIVDDLRSISRELRKSGRGGFGSDPTPTFYRVLSVLGGLFDSIDNSRLAALVVSGAVTAFVGASGWSAATCLALTLSSWHGKDAFMAVVEKVGRKHLRKPSKPRDEITDG